MQKLDLSEKYHDDHKQWNSQINFYFDQIRIFYHELDKVLYKHDSLFSVIEHVEEYEGILAKKIEKLRNLQKQIIMHERSLANDFSQSQIVLWSHSKVQDEMHDIEEKFKLFKISLRKFTSSHI